MLFAICLLDPAEHVTDDRNHESNNRIISYRSYQPTVESLYCELWRELMHYASFGWDITFFYNKCCSQVIIWEIEGFCLILF